MTTAILSDDYRKAIETLKRDEQLFSMVPGILSLPRDEIAWPVEDGGHARHEFMLAANGEYERRCAAAGVEPQRFHLGAVSETLISFYDFLHGTPGTEHEEG